jgi:hypothetical protein
MERGYNKAVRKTWLYGESSRLPGHILTIYYAGCYTVGANETRPHQYVFSP